MDLDKRYVVLLSTVIPISQSEKPRRLALLGFLIILLGALAQFTGRLYGFGIMGAGCIPIGISLVLSSRIGRKTRQEFLSYYEKNGELPPWPEPASKKLPSE